MQKNIDFMFFKKAKTDIIDDKHAEFCHVMFEKTHPFIDFNGRTGRILWNIHRHLLGLPIKIIHEGEEQMEYYKLFN